MALTISACALFLPGPGSRLEGYEFPIHRQPLGGGAGALLEGGLALSGPCLVVVQGSYNVTTVVWPERFSLVMGDDGMLEVHGDGHVFKQGQAVRLGGGEWRPENETTCEGPYFGATSSP